MGKPVPAEGEAVWHTRVLFSGNIWSTQSQIHHEPCAIFNAFTDYCRMFTPLHPLSHKEKVTPVYAFFCETLASEIIFLLYWVLGFV